jgi:ubiquinone/menaquinone biosynthesis C-methylase UbiE
MNLGRDFDAYQDFVLACKLYWTRTIYPALEDTYRERLARAETPPRDAAEAAALMADDTLAQYYGWFERHLQRFKYSGRHGLVPAHEPHREALLGMLDGPLPEGLLELDPDLDLPKYFTSVDIHQHPGGVCGDELAGIVYECGARSTTPLLDRDKDLHYRLTALVAAEHEPRRLLDLGCGFGKSTRPFYSEHREAEITGIDISAPCLKLAAVTAAQDQAANVRFRQRRAEATGFEDEAFDVVTSTMLLHEMPPSAVEQVIAESYRVLEPGGVAVHLDFLADDDPFKRFVHYGHSKRNNEPYMPPLDEMDLEGLHRAAGFRAVRIVPFEEMPGTLAADHRAWRFPWTAIIAEK